MPDPQPSNPPEWTPRRLALVAFPIAVWLFATFALGGALGKSTDDYSTNLRDPVTDRVTGSFDPFHEYAYFWRPAHIFTIHVLQTYLWEHNRLIHFLSAAAHGLVAWLLYRLIVRSTASSAAAYAAALIFLVLPIHFEAVFFTSTIGTLIASALWLWLAVAITRYVATAPTARGRSWLPAMAAIALAIPFFYEQPGAAILALPILMLAVSSHTSTLASRIRQTVGVTLCLLATQAAMLAALLLTAPATRRGSASSLVPIASWPNAILRTTGQLFDLLFGDPGREIARGGLELGWKALSTTHLWVWLVPLALTGAAAVLANAPLSTRDQPPRERPSPSVGRSLAIALFGAAAAFAALLPVALVSGQSVAPRLTYMPALGLCIALGGLCSAVLGTIRGSPSARSWIAALACPLIVGLVLTSAVSLVGSQRWLQLRSRADTSIAAQLRTLVPAPPSGTIFLPTSIDADASRTGYPRFDRLRPGAFETIWSATALTRQTYRRRDLWAAGWNPWRAPMLHDPTPTEVLLNDRFVIWSPFAPSDDQVSTRLPWSSAVPFTVEPSGRVRLIRRVVIENDRAEQVTITLPLTADPPPPGAPSDTADGRPAQATLWLSDTRADPTLQAITDWRFTPTDPGPSRPPDHSPHTLWGRTFPSTWLHPTAESGGRAALAATLPPSDTHRRIIIRATVTGYDLERVAGGSTDILRLETADQTAAELRLAPQRLRRERRWLPLVLTVPPSSTPTELRLTIRAADGATGLPVWVSTGLIGPCPPPR